MKPAFFIIGVPKCGTTALVSYLSEHPDIFMSEPKEPHFFADDFPHYKEFIPTVADYEKLFEDAALKSSARVGEASVWYLYFKSALKNIHAYRPDAKLI
jgi:hypothetical protein